MTNRGSHPHNGRNIAALVPMDALLARLGFEANPPAGKMGRCACIFHGGRSRSAFSWREDGRWYCHNCHRGVDKIGLVQMARRCSYREAVAFLAAMAGVELRYERRSGLQAARERQAQARERQEQARLDAAAENLAEEEREALLAARDDLHALYDLRRRAGVRLAELMAGAPPRFLNEEECAWSALKLVADSEARVLAGYDILAFGSDIERLAFTFCPEWREAIIQAHLEEDI